MTSARSRSAALAAALSMALVGACGSDERSIAGTLVINELMASNTAACVDPFGEFDDWVELYNQGDVEIDLSGFTVTDDPAVSTKATLPAGLLIPARGYRLLWCDGQVQGLDHLAFKLNAASESFAIFTPEGELIDKADFSATVTDTTIARFPDGTGDFTTCARSTCGASNGASCAP